MSRDSMPAGVIYKEVPGFPCYLVGDDGSLWSCWTKKGQPKGGRNAMGDDWKLLKTKPKKDGYLHATLFIDGRRIHRQLHRLVLETFVGPCPPGQEACHDPDPTRTNCRLDNLRWDTRKRNHADKRKHGTQTRGEGHPVTKLTEVQVLEIRSKMGEHTTLELGKMYGVSDSLISAIHLRRVWSHI